MDEIKNKGEPEGIGGQADTKTADKIRAEVEERIQKEIAAYPNKTPEKSNGKITSSFVRQCLHANELGDGMLYSALLRDELVYNNTTREWLVWGGHHWERDVMEYNLAVTETAVVGRLIEEAGQVAKDIGWNTKKGDDKKVDSLQKIQKAIYTRISRLRTDKGRNMAVKFARTNEDPLAIRGDELDLNPWLLPCANGVIDLRTGKLREGRPEDMMFLASPVEYPGVKEPADIRA